MKLARLIPIFLGTLLLAWLGWSFWDAYRPRAVILQGQIEAQEYGISSKVPGRIAAVHVRKGDLVEDGQLVFTIDSPEISAKLEQAQGGEQAASALARSVESGARSQEIEAARDQWETAKAAEELARKTFDRMESLFKDGVIPEQRRDEAYAFHQTALYTTKAAFQVYSMAQEGARSEMKDAAKGQVRAATGMVAEVEAFAADTSVHSSHRGEVATVFLHRGEIAPPGFPVVTIVDVSDAWAIFQVREDWLNAVPKNAEIEVRIPALGAEYFRFRVSHVSVMGDFATWRATSATEGYDLRTFEVEARPINPIEGLRVGMTTLLEIE